MVSQNQPKFNYGISTPIGILIIVVCALLVGGILAWQFGGLKKEAQVPEVKIPKEEIKLPEEKIPEKITRKTLKELVKGKNQIGNVTFEVIEPLLVEYSAKEKVIKEEEVVSETREYRVDPEIKIETKVNNAIHQTLSFTIYQRDEKVNSYKVDWPFAEGNVFTFKYGDKKYIVISASNFGMRSGYASRYLYRLDESDNLEGPLIWEEDSLTPGREEDIFIGYQNNVYIISDVLGQNSEDEIIIRSIEKDKFLTDVLAGSRLELIESKGKLYLDMKDDLSNYYLLTEDGRFTKINKKEIQKELNENEKEIK